MAEMFKALTFGDDEMRCQFEQVMRITRRPRLMMREVAAVLENEADKNFSAQGRPEKWQPLAEATRFKRVGGSRGYKKNGDLRERTKRLLDSMQILVNSGKLAQSVHSSHGDDFAFVGAGGGEVSNYARIHQLGGKAGRGQKVTIPARPFLPFTPDFKLQDGVDKEIVDSALAVLKREISS